VNVPAADSSDAAAERYPPGDAVFVLHRHSEARPVPAYFRKYLWARWCTRLTQEGQCTFRGCTFVHSLSEFCEWAAASNAPPFTARKWRNQQCKLPFRAAVDAAECLESGAPLPYSFDDGLEFNPATPQVVSRDWTQSKGPIMWRMRLNKKPPTLVQPHLAAVLCSSQHVQVAVFPTRMDKGKMQAMPDAVLKRLPWKPFAVNSRVEIRARTTKRELRARIALVFVEGAASGDRGGSGTCTMFTEVQIKAIQPVCLFNEDCDATSEFHNGKQALREAGVKRFIRDPWDDPRLDTRVPLRTYRMPSIRVLKRAASLHANSDVRACEPGLFTPLHVFSYTDRFHSLLCLNHASHLAALQKFHGFMWTDNCHPYKGAWKVSFDTGTPTEDADLFGVNVAVRSSRSSDVVAFGHVTDTHETRITVEFSMEAQPFLASNVEAEVWLFPPSFRYRLMHRAIDDAKPLLSRLFGTSAVRDAWGTTRSQDLIASQAGDWADVLESLDADQRQVVDSLLAQSSQATPTVVMGPFGCGKSHAIIRAILAALFGRAEAGAVLVATQTNSAADHLARAVLRFVPRVSDETEGSKVLRVYATTRRTDTLDPALRDCSNYSARARAFVAPTFDSVQNKLVVITTCVMAGALRSAGYGPAVPGSTHRSAPNHFTDIIIDEAAQVWEPEALIPLSLAGERTKITLVRFGCIGCGCSCCVFSLWRGCGCGCGRGCGCACC